MRSHRQCPRAPTWAAICAPAESPPGVIARTVQARLDERAEDDLAVVRNEGHNESDAIRVAYGRRPNAAAGDPRCAPRRRRLLTILKIWLRLGACEMK